MWRVFGHGALRVALAWPLAILLVIAVPMFLGWMHGLLVTRLNIQPFIVTLCGLLLYRGLARYIAGDGTKGFGSAEGFGILKFLASGRLFHRTIEEESDGVTHQRVVFEGIPMPFVMLIVVAIVMWFLLHRSIYGRYLLAVGRNEEAARFSGINTRLVIASAYVIAGLLTGVAGVLLAFLHQFHITIESREFL